MKPAVRRMPMAPALWGLGIGGLVVASLVSLDLRWGDWFSLQTLTSLAGFAQELWPPDTSSAFMARVWQASWETLAMSALGTVLAAVAGLVLAVLAFRWPGAAEGKVAVGGRLGAQVLLNALRSMPELVWAALCLVAAGLGPFAGTLALALHTTGVLGRLFAEAIENAPPAPALALQRRGVGRARVFGYAVAPLIAPQVLSYTLYRWENNIRAATVMGVVGAGGLGQLLSFHLGLFQMSKTGTVLCATLVLVALVDALSAGVRRILVR